MRLNRDGVIIGLTVALIILAGCSGFLGGSGETTPAASDSIDSTATGNGTASTDSPTDDDIINQTASVDYSGVSYTLTSNMSVTEQGMSSNLYALNITEETEVAEGGTITSHLQGQTSGSLLDDPQRSQQYVTADATYIQSTNAQTGDQVWVKRSRAAGGHFNQTDLAAHQHAITNASSITVNQTGDTATLTLTLPQSVYTELYGDSSTVRGILQPANEQIEVTMTVNMTTFRIQTVEFSTSGAVRTADGDQQGRQTVSMAYVYGDVTIDIPEETVSANGTSAS